MQDTTSITQDQVFAKAEADSWFKRNQTSLLQREAQPDDPILELLEQYSITPQRVLEIGASNGYRLDWICRKYSSHGTAVEPSEAAITDGRSRFPSLQFVQALAHELPLETNSFDLVVIAGVLCWVGRDKILQAIAEADRVLSPGGMLVLAEFLPTSPERVMYHHCPGAEIYTYKQDYAAMFLSSQIYERLATIMCKVGTWEKLPAVAPHDRLAVSLLRKDLQRSYLTKSRPDA